MWKERALWMTALAMAVALPKAWAFSDLSVKFSPPADADALGAVCTEKDPCPSTVTDSDGGVTCKPADYKIYGTMCGIAPDGSKKCANLSTHVALSNAAVRAVRGALFNTGRAVFPP